MHNINPLVIDILHYVMRCYAFYAMNEQSEELYDQSRMEMSMTIIPTYIVRSSST